MNSAFYTYYFRSLPGIIIKKYLIFSLLFFTMNVFLFAQNKNAICLIETREYPGTLTCGMHCMRQKTEKYIQAYAQKAQALIFMCMILYRIRTYFFKGIRTTSKIHNKPVEDNEGNIYFVPIK